MKIVLAYSGGLDTSVALHWLQERYRAEVIPFCADLGQLEDLSTVAETAESTSTSQIRLEDLRREFLSDFVFRALKANAAYEGRYLMAAPLARPLIARRLVEIAHEVKADAVAHGATGKGNDQVRFYSSIVAHDPDLRVIAPLMEWDLKSRNDEIEYAKAHGIPVDASLSKPYSTDTNIWGSSMECGILDDLSASPPEEVYLMTASPQEAPQEGEEIEVGFEQGVPSTLDGQPLDAVSLVSRLNRVGGRHGIGRVDIVENRLAGIKTRGIYESPAGLLLHRAHQELEDIVLDRDTLHHKRMVARQYARLVYFGLWFSPLRQALQAFVDHTQSQVTGRVRLGLYKGNVTVLARESDSAMYDYGLSTYDDDDRFDGTAGEGFSYIWSMPLRVKAQRLKERLEKDSALECAPAKAQAAATSSMP